MIEKLNIDSIPVPFLPAPPVPPEVIERARRRMAEYVERMILGDSFLLPQGGSSTQDYTPQDWPVGECCPIIHRS